jgi:hypothetical protein
MAILLQLLRKNGLLFLSPLGVFMLGLSISSSASASIVPDCDDLACVSAQNAGLSASAI